MLLHEWMNAQETPVGIGVDMVCISEFRALDERLNGVLVRRTFTKGEQQEAMYAADRWSYLAGRFAVKEAVFKAVAQHTSEKTFDFRIVETLSHEDGSPHITLTDPLKAVMDAAGVSKLLVSISNEADFAIAFVQAI